MKVLHAPFLWGGLFAATMPVSAQSDTMMLAQDEHYIIGDAGDDPLPELNRYDSFNAVVGGDSVRHCGAFPCTGWVEDQYPNGQIMHRGYYDSGRLTVYKNYHPNGQVERDFKSVDATQSTLRAWHANGQARSETRYRDGVVVYYEDHYLNGQLRYIEQRHKEHMCFLRLELYGGNGKPISVLKMVDKGKLEMEQHEFHPDGSLKSHGRARYDRNSMETIRFGTWVYLNPDGSTAREEDYVNGKVHTMR